MALFFAMPGNEKLAGDLVGLTCGELGQCEIRRFPDSETYVRVLSEVKRRDVFIVCTLAKPDAQFMALSFTSATLLGLGARRVQLIAPYLSYMRQDRIFHPGEALTSRLFAKLLQQQHFDGLITVDPHLHRHACLKEIFEIPSTIVHAAPLFANWIAQHVDRPVIIGPDAESAQWVETIARDAGAPWTVFSKERSDEGKVRMKAPDLREFRGLVPVLVDDIVSTGTTIIQALRVLTDHEFDPAYCLIVHALCAARTARRIKDNSAGLLTTNTVPNNEAAFDIAPAIADALVTAAASARS